MKYFKTSFENLFLAIFKFLTSSAYNARLRFVFCVSVSIWILPFIFYFGLHKQKSTKDYKKIVLVDYNLKIKP